MNPALDTYRHALAAANDAGALLFLRLILAWEFGEAGLEKLRGENWFAGIQDQFPFPFHLLPAELNWHLATGAELVLAAALVIGLGTRIAALSLLVLTAVATAAVHWPESWSSLAELWQGYAISDKGAGNFKLPLLFALMLLPLFYRGAGPLSADGWLACRLAYAPLAKAPDWRLVAGLVLLVPGVLLVFLIPIAGLAALAAGATLVLVAGRIGAVAGPARSTS